MHNTIFVSRFSIFQIMSNAFNFFHFENLHFEWSQERLHTTSGKDGLRKVLNSDCIMATAMQLNCKKKIP